MRIVCQQTILVKCHSLFVIFEKAAKFEIAADDNFVTSFLVFDKNKVIIRYDISWESSASRRFSYNLFAIFEKAAKFEIAADDKFWNIFPRFRQK